MSGEEMPIPAYTKTAESPILKLPTEVLGEILFRCLPSHCERRWDGLEGSYLYPHEVRNTLEMVCSSWRTTVQRAPQMWSKFLIDSKTLDTLRTRPDVVQLWLKRSGQYPLDLYLDTSLEQDRRVRRLFIEMFEPEISRIRFLRLSIAVEFNRATYFLVDNVQLAPIIEQLYLLWDMELNFATQGFFHAPRLAKLTLLLEAAGFLFCLTKQCLQSLRCLTIQISQTHVRPLAAYLNCLASCVNLEELKIGAADSSGHNWPSKNPYQPSVILPSLKKLTLGLPGGLQKEFCEALILPNLKTFHAFGDYNYGSVSEVFSWFLKEKMLTLTEIFVPCIPGKLIVHLARFVPNLRTFIVNGWCNEIVDIFDVLFPLDSKPPFPCLQNLHVFFYNHDGERETERGQEIQEDEGEKSENITDHNCHEFLVRHIEQLMASENQIHVLERGQSSILRIYHAGMPNSALVQVTVINRKSFGCMQLAEYDEIFGVFR